MNKNIHLIIGAGPTGLGAAWRIQERQPNLSWGLVDSSHTPGGLASSFLDDKGFVWDFGGHVLFSHYEYFDRLLDDLLKEAWVEHVRESWIWMRNRFIPYPMQNHIRYLPIHERWECLLGLLQAPSDRRNGPPAHFKQWLQQHFGDALYKTFLGPYNRKVWAYDPSRLTSDWMSERVATISLARTLVNMLFARDERSWGPNSKFRYPLRGGTGAIWSALHSRLPHERLWMGVTMVSVHTRRKEVTLSNGQILSYEKILSTMPLDRLLLLLQDRQDLWPLAKSFQHSSTHVVGIGLRGQPPGHLRTKCWMYFPEDSVPFYRTTVFSNYSPHNVPASGGPYWSLLTETSESPDKPVDENRLMEDTLKGLQSTILRDVPIQVVSRFHRRLEYGYPTPFLGRTTLLEQIDQELRKHGIWSRGRFGGWKYEVSNQDHSLMQGVEAVDHWLDGSPEITYAGETRSYNSSPLRLRSLSR